MLKQYSNKLTYLVTDKNKETFFSNLEKKTVLKKLQHIVQNDCLSAGNGFKLVCSEINKVFLFFLESSCMLRHIVSISIVFFLTATGCHPEFIEHLFHSNYQFTYVNTNQYKEK